MAVTDTITLKLTYADYTERSTKIPYNFNAQPSPDAAVAKIKAFNTAAATADSAVKQTFVSDNGAAIVAITEAAIVRREETAIYHA